MNAFVSEKSSSAFRKISFKTRKYWQKSALYADFVCKSAIYVSIIVFQKYACLFYSTHIGLAITGVLQY